MSLCFTGISSAHDSVACVTVCIFLGRMTAMWLAENTQPTHAARPNGDLVEAWPHVLEQLNARRESIDDFLQEEQGGMDATADLTKMFDYMVLKKRVSPLDVIEKASEETVEVFDASGQEDTAAEAEIATEKVENAENAPTEASITGPKFFRGEKKVNEYRQSRARKRY